MAGGGGVLLEVPFDDDEGRWMDGWMDGWMAGYS